MDPTFEQLRGAAAFLTRYCRHSGYAVLSGQFLAYVGHLRRERAITAAQHEWLLSAIRYGRVDDAVPSPGRLQRGRSRRSRNWVGDAMPSPE